MTALRRPLQSLRLRAGDPRIFGFEGEETGGQVFIWHFFDTAAPAGDATANGVTVSALASLIAGAGQAASQASGVTVTVAATLIPGAASASSGATANGVTVTATASLVAGAASGNTPPATETKSAAGDNQRRRYYPPAERLWTIADLEEELRKRYRVVREELAKPEPAEAAVRAEEIRDGRDLAALDRPDLFEIAAEVAALIPPMDAAEMLRAIIAIRDDEDAAAALLLSL